MILPAKAFEAARATAPGQRGHNQDRSLFLGSAEALLLGLADGLGGHPRGETAAQLLVDVCESLFRRTTKPLADPEHFMLQCIGQAHKTILRFGRRQHPPITPRTTAVLAVIQHAAVHWAHVGDSRLYLMRDGQVHARTRDHSCIRHLPGSEGEASRPHASLTRCLGGMLQPPITSCGPPTRLQAGDLILLCSDGLWSQIPGRTLIRTLQANACPLNAALPALVKQTSMLPNSDNVTAVALRWLAAPDVIQSRDRADRRQYRAANTTSDPNH
jgi:serine/threonine protein phosphatase PrpC